MPDLVLPGRTDRLAIFGRTGSGKTQAAVWHLSNAAYDKMPWVVMNFKGDDLIDSIPGAVERDMEKSIPKSPGIHIVRPHVFSKEDKELLDDFFHRAWSQRNVGLYVDEGYHASGCKWFRACLTQGRSRHVPMIVLSQQPVWMDTFVWSEADYFQAFHLNRHENIVRAEQMIPGYRDARATGLKAYHSVWHDVSRARSFILRPVPGRDTILQTFRARKAVQTRIVA